jgi:hypothetical protein
VAVAVTVCMNIMNVQDTCAYIFLDIHTYITANADQNSKQQRLNIRVENSDRSDSSPGSSHVGETTGARMLGDVVIHEETRRQAIIMYERACDNRPVLANTSMPTELHHPLSGSVQNVSRRQMDVLHGSEQAQAGHVGLSETHAHVYQVPPSALTVHPDRIISAVPHVHWGLDYVLATYCNATPTSMSRDSAYEVGPDVLEHVVYTDVDGGKHQIGVCGTV